MVIFLQSLQTRSASIRRVQSRSLPAMASPRKVRTSPDNADDCKDLVRPGLCTRIKAELPAIRERLRERHPLPDFRALRRARLPIYVSLHTELTEDGFDETAAFLTFLIAEEEAILARATEGLRLRRLSDIPVQLETMLNAIKQSERQDDDAAMPLNQIVQELLTIGVQFMEGRMDFQWVAEYVLLHALRETRKILLDGSEGSARVLYFLGKFYFLNQRFQDANGYLNEGLHLSESTEWIVSKSVNVMLYSAISSQYCSSLNANAHVILGTDPNKARSLCDQAVAVAKSSKSVDALANAYTCYGQVLMKMERFDQACKMFEMCLEQRRSDNNWRNLCRGELDLAECLFRMNQLHNSLRHSKRAYKTAHANDLVAELGDAYAMMAKNERHLGVNYWGAQNYIKAVSIYNSLGEAEKTRRARCYAAIAMAQGIIGPYTETVLKSDKETLGDNPYMLKLLNWKLSREPFWDRVDNGVKVVSETDTSFSAGSNETDNLMPSKITEHIDDIEESEPIDALLNSVTLKKSVSKDYEQFRLDSLSALNLI